MPTIAGLLARRFIARPDAYAVQKGDGQYYPARAWNEAEKKYSGPLFPITPDVLKKHVAGEQPIGHYLVNQEGMTKLFALDIDFRNASAPWMNVPSPKDLESLAIRFGDKPNEFNQAMDFLESIQNGNPRELWQDKSHPSRKFFLLQMRNIAELFTQRISSELQIPTAAAYSGFKGIHVYGWTGLLPAQSARDLGEAVLQSFDRFHPIKGKNFWIDSEEDPHQGFRQFEIELFPKQDEIGHGGFGNLMRLPLGVNKKNPNGKAFFIDQRSPAAGIVPREDPETLLEHGDPWK